MRGQIIERGDRKWLLRVYAGRDGTGKRRYVSRTFEGTFSQASKEMTAMQGSRDRKTLTIPSKQTCAAYLDEWLEGRRGIRARTRTLYARMLLITKTHIGHLAITSIEHSHIELMVTDLMKLRRGNRTIQSMMVILHGAFEKAVERGILVRNPTDYIELAKPVATRNVADECLSAEEVREMLGKTAGERFHPLWTLLVTTGMRPEEALALTWDDLTVPDVGDAWVSIHRTNVEQEIIEDTKTASSKRRISLPKNAVEALKVQRVSQVEDRLYYGPNYEDQNLIFCSKTGKPLAQKTSWLSWKRTLVRCKMRHVRLYALRHTHATLLLEAGADIAWVSARLGHKNIAITASTYAHVKQEANRGMALMVDKALAL